MYVAPWLICGGADRCIIDMAIAIHSREGGDSILLTLREHSQGNPWVKHMPEGTRHYDISSDDCTTTQSMIDLIASCRPDRIIASNAHEFIANLDSVRLAAPTADICILNHMHLPGEWNFIPDLVKFSDHYDTVFTVSEALRKDCIEAGVPEEKVKTLHWFGFSVIPQTGSATATKAKLGVPNDCEFVLWPFRMEDQKMPERIINVANFLHRRYPRIHHVVAGDGSRKAWVEQCSREMGLDDVMHFVGPVANDQMPHLIHASMCIATLSRAEGIPLCYYEALQLGRPVICTNVGAVDELIDSKVGMLIDPAGDEREIAKRAASAIAAIHSPPGTFEKTVRGNCIERYGLFTYDGWKNTLFKALGEPKMHFGYGSEPHEAPYSGKVFMIGCPQTGEELVAKALTRLGFHVKLDDDLIDAYHCAGVMDEVLEYIGSADAFASPFGLGDTYKMLAERFPNAKFILTNLDVAKWMKSFSESYEVPRFVDQVWMRFYQKRNKEIGEFFKDKPGRLAVLNIGADGGVVLWRKLCALLDIKRIPETDFPK